MVNDALFTSNLVRMVHYPALNRFLHIEHPESVTGNVSKSGLGVVGFLKHWWSLPCVLL